MSRCSLPAACRAETPRASWTIAPRSRSSPAFRSSASASHAGPARRGMATSGPRAIALRSRPRGAEGPIVDQDQESVAAPDAADRARPPLTWPIRSTPSMNSIEKNQVCPSEVSS